jgi:putative phosphoribosyl transferase
MVDVPFANRREAGRALGEELARLDPPDPVVLGLPRGGVPVAYEVALALDCPLDVLVVRKIGVPQQPELAMGSVGEGDVVIENEDVIRAARVDRESFDRVLEQERGVLRERLDSYRQEASSVDVTGCTAILVDDGLATGSTARAAIEILRRREVSAAWLAVPVAPADTTASMERLADRVIVLHVPRHFGAVGAWYRDFSQTSDDQVRSFLSEARLR